MSGLNPLVNTSDPRQDVYGTRRVCSERSRYRFAESLLPPQGRGLRLLDVGGGMAEFASRCTELGYQVTLTDLNPQNVSNAVSLGLEAHQIDLNFGLVGIEDKAFDVVVMLEVIEHIVNAEVLLNDVWRVVRAGGMLVLSTPNFSFWKNRLAILFGGIPPDEGYHYRFFTKETLQKKLRSSGLQPETWKFSSPAFGINKLRRIAGRNGRKHVLIPDWLGPVLGQTLFVRARA